VAEDEDDSSSGLYVYKVHLRVSHISLFSVISFILSSLRNLPLEDQVFLAIPWWKQGAKVQVAIGNEEFEMGKKNPGRVKRGIRW
jgi:hypothetical protein